MSPSLTPVSYTETDAAERFVESLRVTGFGVLTNHPLGEATVTGIYNDWLGFFTGPDADKARYKYDPVSFDGFFPISEAESAKGQQVRDLKEYYHYYPWGRCPQALQAAIADYYKQAVTLATTLLEWVEAHTPVEISQRFSTTLGSMIEGSEQSLLRILHYPPLPADREPDAVRAAAHEDINLLTILPASNEPGLQVKTTSGDWLDVPCDFGNLIVNTGDMLQEASGGYFPSTTHRVINPEGQRSAHSRISLPLFLHPRPEIVLSSRYTADSYRRERLAELRETKN